RHRVRIPPSTLENSTSRVTLGSESGIESAEVTPTRVALQIPSINSLAAEAEQFRSIYLYRPLPRPNPFGLINSTLRPTLTEVFRPRQATC
ncbi:hypothetical protein PoB_004798700, partial [Plakobranchus ocellatus]